MTKAELKQLLAEVEGRLDAVIDVLEDPDIEDEAERVAEALAYADPGADDDED